MKECEGFFAYLCPLEATDVNPAILDCISKLVRPEINEMLTRSVLNEGGAGGGVSTQGLESSRTTWDS